MPPGEPGAGNRQRSLAPGGTAIAPGGVGFLVGSSCGGDIPRGMTRALRAAAASCNASSRVSATGQKGGITVAHVLVIDDNPMQRQLVREVLEARGDVVLEAADGAEGFDTLLRSSLPLVVLFDYQMPTMDGFALLQRVVGDATILGRNAFILSTSSGEDQLPALFLQLLTQLAIPILLKPMPLDQLQQAVGQAAVRLSPDTGASASGTG